MSQKKRMTNVTFERWIILLRVQAGTFLNCPGDTSSCQSPCPKQIMSWKRTGPPTVGQEIPAAPPSDRRQGSTCSTEALSLSQKEYRRTLFPNQQNSKRKSRPGGCLHRHPSHLSQYHLWHMLKDFARQLPSSMLSGGRERPTGFSNKRL